MMNSFMESAHRAFRKVVKNERADKKPQEKKPLPRLKIIPLGGLGEIGKNLTVFEYENDIFVVDCGLTFPDEELPGVDLVIPDMSYLVKNKDKVRGVVITHAHEDHIGAIPYLLREIKAPIYCTALTAGLVSLKVGEHKNLGKVKINVKRPGDRVQLGCFNIEFIRVNHSIADACGFAIKTPVGTVVMTGDFKIDPTPVKGQMIDLERFGALGREGVLLLMSDSTNAERAGFSMSERKVGKTFDAYFKGCDRRIIVASFASNVDRIQQIISCAVKYGRKVAVSGRSMENILNVALELGYIKAPEGTIIELHDINR
ncbi:MAG: ribonuclease J, partial [Clostridia bacterium]|nr:ribonuclease J [Clostridia bacterium]